MDSTVKISVVLPAYNSQRTIIQCINSVINQTIPIFELIIINDGSTDNTTSLLLKHIKEHPSINFKYINQSNKGPSAARNKGIKLAQGNWIAFIDADDRWLPEKLERQLQILKLEPNCKIIGSEICRNKKTYKKKYEFISFYNMLFSNYFITSTVIIKKEIIWEYLFDEQMKFSEDYKLWLQVIGLHQGIILHDQLIIYGDNENKFLRNSLSSKLWEMEKGELSNFLFLYKTKLISIFLLSEASIYSLLKFTRRIINSKLTKIFIFKNRTKQTQENVFENKSFIKA